MYLPGLLLLMLLLPPLSLQDSHQSENKIAMGRRILSALEKATSYLENRYREFDLDSLVGFLMLKEFQEILQPEFWKLSLSWSHTNSSMIYSKFDNSNRVPEKLSDSCITLLLGSKEKNRQPCNVTKFCMEIMTAPKQSGKELIKQLSYFQIAKMKKCSAGLFLRSKYYMDVFCSNLMELNLKIEKSGFLFQNKSLFMTNIMLCGFSGYSDFYKIQWIKAILNWQNYKEGCYWKIFVLGNQPLMRDNHLEGGCSSRNTAAAVVSLGGFLYYFKENSPTINKSN
ncbi:UPF0764 protein C16orf89 homolog isoform X2 [Antechinus flavipes]|uniref:UPF0764 protein C16orf89 homolog isoform X2 n=1 Tax=Antechinus flavipes TaxID=38775 RepID=UPI0022367731|nr:UPF0764 protein C16orf89 homolog isoform X2 [Antechinus flavipes]